MHPLEYSSMRILMYLHKLIGIYVVNNRWQGYDSIQNAWKKFYNEQSTSIINRGIQVFC